MNMSFTNRITDSDFNNKDISSLPDVPTMGATDLKARFDANAKEVITPKHNGLIDELQSVSAASNIGATAPSGRSGGTVQEVLNDISTDLITVESEAHTHTNKESCLDYLSDNNNVLNYRGQPISGGGGGSYTQGDGISISNNVISARLDSTTMEFSGGNIKSKNSHTHANKTLLDGYTQTNTSLSDAVAKKHEHANFEVLSSLSDSNGKLAYDGNVVGAGLVTWQQNTLSGTKIAEITIEGNTTDVYAPTGGGGGATDYSALTSKPQINSNELNGNKTSAQLGLAAASHTHSISNVTDLQTTLNNKASKATTLAGYGITDAYTNTEVDNALAVKANSSDLATVATSGSYNDLSNTPSLATVATSGSYNDLSNTPTIPTQLSQLTGDATHRVVTDTEKSTWNGKVDAVSVSRTGTASSSVTSAQFVSVTDAGGSAVTYEIDGSKYMERKNTSSTSYVFSNSAITTDSTIDVYTSTWGDNPSNVTVSNGSCTVTFASATTRNVKIYIR